MNALNKFIKENKTKELNKLKSGTKFKNYFNKNKYFFNEIYKNKILPKEDLVFIVTRILKHDSDNDIDIKLKNIARGFVDDHHELFPDGVEDGGEGTDDEYDNVKHETQENVSKNDDENHDKNDDEKHDENTPKDTIEKIEEIKQEVEKIEEIRDQHPNFKHIEEFHKKIEELKDDINKKFEDMIDSHMDLRKSIEEKRNISHHDAKARIENMEGKIEMLYGKQMEENIKHKKQYIPPRPITKEDVLNSFVNKKLNK